MISRDEYATHFGKFLRKNRSRELPGNFSPMIVLVSGTVQSVGRTNIQPCALLRYFGHLELSRCQIRIILINLWLRYSSQVLLLFDGQAWIPKMSLCTLFPSTHSMNTPLKKCINFDRDCLYRIANTQDGLMRVGAREMMGHRTYRRGRGKIQMAFARGRSHHDSHLLTVYRP